MTFNEIRPFIEVNKFIKNKVISSLNEEWGHKTAYTHDFIINTWKFPDVLYIMTDNLENFVGCVAIDRHYIIPVISHLYINKDYRKNGKGPKLLKFAEKHCRCVGYKHIYGFCQMNRVKYYTSLGWHQNKWSSYVKPFSGLVLMSKEA